MGRTELVIAVKACLFMQIFDPLGALGVKDYTTELSCCSLIGKIDPSCCSISRDLLSLGQLFYGAFCMMTTITG